MSVYDFNNEKLDETTGIYKLSINWSPDAVFTCSQQMPWDLAGTISVDSCSFSTTGDFMINFSSPFLDSVNMGPYSITSPNLNKISLSGPLKVSTYIEFTIKVSLLDSNNALVINPSASLTISSTIPIFGSSLVVITSSAETDLIFYCEDRGIAIISIETSGKFESISIEIVKNYLRIESFSIIVISKQPTETTSVFDLEVAIYNYDFLNKASDHGSFSIRLSLDSPGILSGSPIKTSINGVAKFSSLSITTKGIYSILADEIGSIQAKSDEMAIGMTTIKSQTVNINPSQISKYQNFTLEVVLFDQDGAIYNFPSSISIVSNCSELCVSSFIIETGEHNFSLYSSESITCDIEIISASSIIEGSVSTSKSVNFLDNLIIFSASAPLVSYN